MVEFKINSSLGDTTASVKRQGRIENITINKNLYEREIGVRWVSGLSNNRSYKINRNGVWNRFAVIQKGNTLLGKVETSLGLNSTVRITNGNGTRFELKEKKNPLNREFNIMKNGSKVGEFELRGVHLPMFSRFGKGIYGYYNHLEPKEEELLMTSLIALGI